MAFPKSSTIALIANGVITDYQTIAAKVRFHEKIVAVDGGLDHCARMGIVPDLILGDFDSVSPNLLKSYAHVPTQHYPTEKDKTDLEIAIEQVYHPEVQRITVFAALERRFDHTLNNVHLMRRYPQKVFIESDHETLFIIDRPLTINCHPGQTVSLIPIGENVNDVTTRGLKWELQNADLSKDFLSLSNICLGESFSVRVDNGHLICTIVHNGKH